MLSVLVQRVTCDVHFGTSWDHRAIQEALVIQAWIPDDFGWIAGPHLTSVWLTLERHMRFFHTCFQVTLFVDFGV